MNAAMYKELLANFNGKPPASADAIRRFEMQTQIRLPESYVQFLYASDGGEGFIGANAYVIFWSVEELAELNVAYEVAKYAPGLVVFGSDGGGEAFALDTRGSGEAVVSVPFVGMSLEASRVLAHNFDGFLDHLSKQ